MACVEDDIREREAKEFGKGLDSKVKVALYRRFGGNRVLVMRELNSCLSLDKECTV